MKSNKLPKWVIAALVVGFIVMAVMGYALFNALFGDVLGGGGDSFADMPAAGKSEVGRVASGNELFSNGIFTTQAQKSSETSFRYGASPYEADEIWCVTVTAPESAQGDSRFTQKSEFSFIVYRNGSQWSSLNTGDEANMEPAFGQLGCDYRPTRYTSN